MLHLDSRCTAITYNLQAASCASRCWLIAVHLESRCTAQTESTLRYEPT